MKKRILGVFITMLLTLSADAELPFIEDDYSRALSLAKAKNVPLFIEAWAPW